MLREQKGFAMKRLANTSRLILEVVLLGAIVLILVVMLRTLNPGAGSQAYPPPAGTSGAPPYPPPESTLTTPLAALQTEENQRNATLYAESTALTNHRIPTWTAQAQASVQPTSTPLPSGEQCFVDRYDHISLWLPSGWRGMGEDRKGTDYFFNYSEADLPPRGGFPPGGIKVEIEFAQVKAGQTFEQWYSDLVARMAPDAPTPYPYELGKHKGYAQDLQGDEVGSMVITLPRGDGGVVLIGLMPANSPALSDALKMLSTLDISGSDVCSSTETSSSIPKILSGNAKLAKLAAIPLLEPTCQTGTFPGNEAYKSTLKLEMPFRTGQSWTVGEPGSFYGNFHHCNYYNEYYATDWNRPGDSGSEVLAVASGYVSDAYFGPCVYSTTNRYGCYVDITHSNGYRTRYAHLQSVEVAIGQLVYTGDWIGIVGGSGNCEEAHLHLSFWHQDSGNYYSHCYNNGSICPNGESPVVPQGYRPSPMMTTNGSTTLQDGQTYTSINGKIYLPDLRNKDNIISVFYVRNDDNVYQLVPMDFYDSAGGNPRRHDECPLDPDQQCMISVNDYNRIASNSVGTAIVGGNGKVSIVVTQYRTNQDLYAAYNGVNRTSTEAHVPLLHKNNYGFYSYIFIQNTTASTASYTVYFKANIGTTCSKTYSSIQPHQLLIIDLKNDSLCIGSTYVGSAYITSNQPVAVTSIQYHWNGSQFDSLLESEYASNTANTVFAPLYQNAN